MTPPAELLARALVASREIRDDLEREEAALLLLAMLTSGHAGHSESRPGKRRLERLDEVCELLASRPEAPWRLAGLAAAVNVSPFYLAREFRALTGTTLGGYLLRLRLSIVIERIAEGEPSLARIATDTGFAHHSHLTERFRSVFGITPSEVRRSLTRGSLANMTAL